MGPKHEFAPGALMSRWILVIIPLVTCTVVLVAVFVVGNPQPRPAALLYGGPTSAESPLAWTVEVEHVGEGESTGPPYDGPIVVDVVTADGHRSGLRRPMRGGRADILFRQSWPARGPLSVVVRAGDGRLLARGPVELDREAWSASARRRGGWVQGRQTGDLQVDVAPARGALPVDLVETVLIRVHQGSGPAPGASVRIRAEGANVAVASTDPVIGSESALAAVADAKGWVAVDIQPFDFNVTLAVTASSTSDKTGEWMGALPVVPGAMRATLHGGRLLVTSPIPRRVGYLSLVTEGARIASARLEFRPGPRGRAVAFHELPQHVTVHKSLWAVVSAEPHLDAAATVGWPIMLPSRKGHTLQESYTVADRLLLDGRPLIRHLQQNQRRRAQWLAGLFCALAVLLVAALTLSRARSAHHHLVRHLRAAGQSDADVVRVAGERRWLWVTALAIFLLALGYAIVALVAIARVG